MCNTYGYGQAWSWLCLELLWGLVQWPASSCITTPSAHTQPSSSYPCEVGASPQLHRCVCRVYELYADYVLKNPFHEMDQVIKAELFDSHLVATLSASNRKWGAA